MYASRTPVMGYIRNRSHPFTGQVQFECKDPATIRKALLYAIYQGLPGEQWYQKSLEQFRAHRNRFGGQHPNVELKFPVQKYVDHLETLTSVDIANINEVLGILRLPSFESMSQDSKNMWRIGLGLWKSPKSEEATYCRKLLKLTGAIVIPELAEMIAQYDHLGNRFEFRAHLGGRDSVTLGCLETRLRGAVLCEKYVAGKSILQIYALSPIAYIDITRFVRQASEQ